MTQKHFPKIAIVFFSLARGKSMANLETLPMDLNNIAAAAVEAAAAIHGDVLEVPSSEDSKDPPRYCF